MEGAEAPLQRGQSCTSLPSQETEKKAPNTKQRSGSDDLADPSDFVKFFESQASTIREQLPTLDSMLDAKDVPSSSSVTPCCEDHRVPLQANGSPALQPRVRTAHDLAPSSLSSLIKVASEPSLKARIPRTPKRTPDPYRSAKWRDHPSPGDPSSRQTTPRRGGQRRGPTQFDSSHTTPVGSPRTPLMHAGSMASTGGPPSWCTCLAVQGGVSPTLERLHAQCLSERCSMILTPRYSNIDVSLDTAETMRRATRATVDALCGVVMGTYRNGLVIVRPPPPAPPPPPEFAFAYDMNRPQLTYVTTAMRTLRECRALSRLVLLDLGSRCDTDTQRTFAHDASVLHISMHEPNKVPSAWPGGRPADVGFGSGLAYTVNIVWPRPEEQGQQQQQGDIDYITAMRTLVVPMIRSFRPDMVLLRTRFSDGPPPFTPSGLAYITHLAMSAAHSRVLVVHEERNGDAAVKSEDASEDPSQDPSLDMPACIAASVRTLLGGALPPIAAETRTQKPSPIATAALQTTLHTTAQDLATRHGVWWTDVQKSWCMAEMSIAEQENLVHDKTDTSVRETAETLAALCMVNPHAPPAYGAAHPHPHPQQNGGARHPHEHDSAATLLSMHQR